MILGFSSGLAVKNLPACSGQLVSIPGSGRSPGEGNGNPLLCACLGNPTDHEPGYTPWSHIRTGRELVTKQQTTIYDSVYLCNCSFWSSSDSASNLPTATGCPLAVAA